MFTDEYIRHATIAGALGFFIFFLGLLVGGHSFFLSLFFGILFGALFVGLNHAGRVINNESVYKNHHR